jgi:hypothetical protein
MKKNLSRYDGFPAGYLVLTFRLYTPINIAYRIPLLTLPTRHSIYR